MKKNSCHNMARNDAFFLRHWIEYYGARLGKKIYRVGILMYGKKPTIKEIMKWIRYK